MSAKLIKTHAVEETLRCAAQFAQDLPSGVIVGLIGPLGSGKTTFVQGMAEGIGIDPEKYVTSPTFALIHEYEGIDHNLYHFDLYRLNSFQELVDIGWEDYTERDGICVLEWADRFPELSDVLTHRVYFEFVGETERGIKIETL